MVQRYLRDESKVYQVPGQAALVHIVGGKRQVGNIQGAVGVEYG